MPRVSRQQVQANHVAIQETAAKRFREKGIGTVSIHDLMAEVGLTHGGFYRHFGSKEELSGRAMDFAFDQVRSTRAEWQAEKPKEHTALQALVTKYLSTRHRERQALGCPIVALASDIAREDKNSAASLAYRKGTEDVLKEIESLIPESDASLRHQQAVVCLAMMVGALTLSRATKGSALSQEVLEAVTQAILNQ